MFYPDLKMKNFINHSLTFLLNFWVSFLLVNIGNNRVDFFMLPPMVLGEVISR